MRGSGGGERERERHQAPLALRAPRPPPCTGLYSGGRSTPAGGGRTWRAFFSLASSSSRFRFCRDRAHTSVRRPVLFVRGEGAGAMADTALSRLVGFSERRGGGLGQGRSSVQLQSTRRYRELTRSSAGGCVRPNSRHKGSLTYAIMPETHTKFARLEIPEGGGFTGVGGESVRTSMSVFQETLRGLMTMSRGSQPSHLSSHLVAGGIRSEDTSSREF